jgi:diguanylate cyclase (GGDEF)-like protein
VLTDAESLERKAAEARLMRQAFRDPLTGLANRALFFDRLANALSRADRRGSSVALVLIDLDDFKKVNDSWGHAGDAVMGLARCFSKQVVAEGVERREQLEKLI